MSDGEKIPEETRRKLASIENALAVMGPEKTMLLGWVSVAEYMDDKGNKWLGVMRQEGMTQWQARGMMLEADEIVKKDEDE